MPTISDYLSQLQTDKENLVNNLLEKGVEASNEETFTTLVPKVNDIETGGGDVSEYFDTEINENTSSTKSFIDISVKKIPELTVGENVTTVYYAFYNYLGGEIPKLNILSKKINSFSYMFANCKNIKSIPFIDTSTATIFRNMFQGCSNLIEIPLLDTSNATELVSFFNGCSSLETIPPLDTSNNSSLEYTFQNCSSLTTIPELNSGNVKNINTYSFKGCSKLTTLGGFLNLGKNCTYTSSNTSNHILYLSESPLLTHDSLLNVINKLYDLHLTYDVANGGTLYTQRLQIGSTNIAKLTADEIAIATNKGWTVS